MFICLVVTLSYQATRDNMYFSNTVALSIWLLFTHLKVL